MFPSPSISGFYQPEADLSDWGLWVSDKIRVPVAIAHSSRVSIEGFHFGEILREQNGNSAATYEVRFGTRKIHETTIADNGPFTIAFEMAADPSEFDSALLISSSRAFCPREMGDGEDARRLSWRLLRIRVTGWRTLDFTASPSLIDSASFVPFSQQKQVDLPTSPLILAIYRDIDLSVAENNGDTGQTWASVTSELHPGKPRAPNFFYFPALHGFYNSACPEVLTRHAAIAASYGINGFCFDHNIHSTGERGMNCAEAYLTQVREPLPFGLRLCCERLQDEGHPLSTSAIAATTRLVRDSRYIRIGGAPLVLLDQTERNSPDIAESLISSAARLVSSHFAAAGVPTIHLLVRRRLPTRDALSLWPVPGTSTDLCVPQKSPFESHANFAAISVGAVSTNSTDHSNQHDPFAPDELAKALDNVFQAMTDAESEERGLLLVDAWNDWQAGHVLEPDQHFGFARLTALAAATRNNFGSNQRQVVAAANASFRRHHRAVVILHVYYEDLIDSMFDRHLLTIKQHCDLIVTCNVGISATSIMKMKSKFPNSYFMVTENRGRDIRPFLLAVQRAKLEGYELVCKLHTKKSLHASDGGLKRESAFETLIGQTDSIIQLFDEDPRVALLAPKDSVLKLSSARSLFAKNTVWLDQLLTNAHRAELMPDYDFHFPAGSMYWLRLESVAPMLEIFTAQIDSFELEAGQLDGTLAHAIERLICISPSGSRQLEYEIHSTTQNSRAPRNTAYWAAMR